MFSLNARKSILFSAILLMATITVAYAQGDSNGSGGGMMGNGPGYRGHMSDYGPGYRGNMPGPGMMGYGYGGPMMGPGMMGYGYGGPMMGPGMMGYGYGGPMMGPGMMGYGYGGRMMGPGMMGYGYGGPMWGPGTNGYGPKLTDDQLAKLDAAREHFFTDTADLRSQIREKQFELRNEMNKDNPDEAKVMQLQKDLSNLNDDFSQKSLQYQLEVRKLVPEQDLGYGYGGGFSGGRCW